MLLTKPRLLSPVSRASRPLSFFFGALGQRSRFQNRRPLSRTFSTYWSLAQETLPAGLLRFPRNITKAGALFCGCKVQWFMIFYPPLGIIFPFQPLLVSAAGFRWRFFPPLYRTPSPLRRKKENTLLPFRTIRIPFLFFAACGFLSLGLFAGSASSLPNLSSSAPPRATLEKVRPFPLPPGQHYYFPSGLFPTIFEESTAFATCPLSPSSP